MPSFAPVVDVFRRECPAEQEKSAKRNLCAMASLTLADMNSFFLVESNIRLESTKSVKGVAPVNIYTHTLAHRRRDTQTHTYTQPKSRHRALSTIHVTRHHNVPKAGSLPSTPPPFFPSPSSLRTLAVAGRPSADRHNLPRTLCCGVWRSLRCELGLAATCQTRVLFVFVNSKRRLAIVGNGFLSFRRRHFSVFSNRFTFEASLVKALLLIGCRFCW